MTGGLSALLEIVRNIHCRYLVVDRTPNGRIQMRHRKLDVQTFAVGIEDQSTAIGVGNLGVQISL